jgi:hypothetical protein
MPSSPPVPPAAAADTASTVKTTTMEALLEASSRDADAMLSGLSKEEIRQRQQELERTLSPDLLTFMRTRKTLKSTSDDSNHHRNGRDQKRGSDRDRADDGIDPDSTAHCSSSSESTKPTTILVTGDPAYDESGEQNRTEKERVARVLSSIRTFQDLDAAYEAEMNQEHEDDRVPNSEVGDTRDEFSLACELLRSSSRRQTVWAARTVANRLRSDLDSGACCSLTEDDDGSEEGSTPWPYPTLLPVSLRCLLDAPIGGSSGYVLHTHVLQSIYYLLQLRACPSHVVDMSNMDTMASIYQLYFMDDSIPSPRISCCYSAASATAPSDNGSLGSDYTAGACAAAAVYDTSSQSAQSDGMSFAADPMWTLLSKMRIIPRLSTLVRPSTSSVGDAVTLAFFSDEAAIATCGILAMLAQRSPGAAVAIVQHRTLLSDLLIRSTLFPSPNDSIAISAEASDLDPKLAVPGLRLLCCLARQSRKAAQLLDVEAFLFRVVSLGDSLSRSDVGKRYYHLQVWALVLWRTLLRYGLALELTPTMLTLTVTHMTAGPSSTSLGPEIFSALGVVSRCVRVASQRQGRDQNEDSVPIEPIAHLSGGRACVISTWRHALKHLSNSSELSFLIDDDPAITLSGLRFYGSCLRFAEGYMDMQLVDESELSGDVKTSASSIHDDDSLVSSLLLMVKSDSFRDAVRFMLFRVFAQPNGSSDSAGDFQREAATSIFLESLTALVNHLRNYASAVNMRGFTLFSQLEASVGCVMVEEVVSAIREAGQGPRPLLVMSRCRRAWQTRMLSSTCNLLASMDDIHHRSLARFLSLYTIGHLECGDESRAAILFSHDWMFQPHSSSVSVSPVASMLIRELCRTQVSRSQVDHSFKLSGGFGITTSGGGSFELQSLRSEVDYVQPRATGEQLQLPFGPLWVWQILSGVIVVEDEDHEPTSNEVKSGEVAAIISSTLELILDLETSHDAFACWYATSFEIGTKLYHTVNVCLQPEPVFRTERIQLSVTCLLEIYTASRFDWVKSFTGACKSHSLTKTRKSDDHLGQTIITSRSDEVKVKQLLLPQDDSSARALEDFVSDLCDAFVEFGAEYPVFAQCVRLFLLPDFPAPVRCLVLHKLRGVTHLLTLAGDNVPRLLPRYLLGGLPDVDQSSKDDPTLTESLCATFHKSLGSRFESMGLVQSLAVAILVRSVASCVGSTNDDASGNLRTCSRRLGLVHRDLGVHVIQGASHFLLSNGRLPDLIEATFAPLSTLPCSTIESAFENSREWDHLIAKLRLMYSERKRSVAVKYQQGSETNAV